MMSNPFKAIEVLTRADGSEVKITAEVMHGLGLQASIDVHVHYRKSAFHVWKLANNRPHPDWRKMPVADYVSHGRSEMLTLATPGEILKVTKSLASPTPSRFSSLNHWVFLWARESTGITSRHVTSSLMAALAMDAL